MDILSMWSLVFLILSLLHVVTSQSRVDPTFYTFGNAAPFNGSSLTSADCGMGCFKLTDNITGPIDSIYDDLGIFFAFSQQSGAGRVFVLLPVDVDVSRVVLYFFNSPMDSIGLPQISITEALVGGGVGSIPFTYDDNNELDQNDSRIRNVSLNLMESSNAFTINIIFINSIQIDWFLLSEVEFYNGSLIPPPLNPLVFQDSPSQVSLGPDNPQSSVSISCTLVNSGSFEWMWEYEGSDIPVDRSEVWIADATRTSILVINELRYTDSGNYTCSAKHTTDNTYYNRSVELILKVDITPLPSENNSLLICEMFGFLQSGIEWIRNNEILENEGRYTITSSSNGTSKSIDFTGNLTGGVVSQLHISNPSIDDTGVYTCRVIGTNIQETITLNIGPTETSSMQSSTSMQSITGSRSMQSTTASTVLTSTPTSSLPANNNNVVIAAGISVAVIILFLIVIVVVVILIVICSRRKRKMTSDLIGIGTELQTNNLSSVKNGKEKESELVYSVVVKKDPPAIPPQNFTSDDVSNQRTTKQVNNLQWQTSTQPQLAKITTLAGFDLVDNPLYEDKNNVITSRKYTDNANYSYAGVPHVSEPIYSEADGVKSDSTAIDGLYSTAKPHSFELDLVNPIYNEPGGDSNEPFSFVQSSTYSGGPIYADPETLSKPTIMEIRSEFLHEFKQLGVGQFGEVVLAETIGLSLKDLGLSPTDDDASVSVQVAVKKMKFDADDISKQSFEKEMKFMSQLRHKNVIQLLAIGQQESDPFMVMEYMENGDLNQFLLWHHFTATHPPGTSEEISPQILLSISIQIASGMSYLASKNYIHRDLASRNCLVGKDYVVKIADFGLSRSLYDSVYYRVKGKAKMPIRWMATECFYGKFSQMSDVWAYGVTVWEIYTMAREPPYPTLTDQQLIEDALKGNYRTFLYKPSSCPKEVYYVLRNSCWAPDTKQRAPFSELYLQLLDIQSKLY